MGEYTEKIMLFSKPRNRRVVLSAVMATLVAGFLFSSAVYSRATAVRDTYESLEVFASIIQIVQKHYVDEVTTEQLIDGAVNGMMAALDPHSAYLPPDHYRELQVDTKGTFGGLGIEITVREGVLTIITPLEETPAFKAGVKPGDQIIKIDDQSTKDMTLMEAVSLMRGPKGTSVVLTLHRPADNRVIEAEIMREIIRVKSVKDMKVVEEKYAYVRIAQFQEGTARELEQAIKVLDKQAAEPLGGLILDLRHNPGGLLSEAVKVSDLFLDAGLIVYTEGRTDNQKQRFLADNDESEPVLNIVAMVDEGSASASEIVAGALQDHRLAVVVGTTSFGKGSVQTILPLDRESALRLTTARYYTPSGRSIHEVGIQPDVIVERFNPSETEGTPTVDPIDARINGEEDKTPDPQLAKAVEVLSNWEEYSPYGSSRFEFEPVQAAAVSE